MEKQLGSRWCSALVVWFPVSSHMHMVLCSVIFHGVVVRTILDSGSLRSPGQFIVIVVGVGLAWSNVVVSRGVPLDHFTGAVIIHGIFAAAVVAALIILRMPRWWGTAGGWAIVGLGLLAVANNGPVSRQALNLITYALVAGPIWWASREGNGSWQLPVVMFISFVWPVSAMRDVRIPVDISKSGTGGIFRFDAGWPDGQSVIEHRMHWDGSSGLAPSAVGIEVGEGCDPMVRLEGWVARVGSKAGQPGGLGKVLGLRHLGFAQRASPETWIFRLEQDDWSPDGDLTIRIRLNPFTSACSLLAMRWTSAASGGVGASATVSGEARTSGVFDPASSALRAGVLLIRPVEIDTVR